MLTRRAVLKSLAVSSAACLTGAAETAGYEIALHDPMRPSFHYLPARNWMNDPCGPIYFKGQYHLFHQYNPHGPLWGDMHWAHAVSPDMVRWTRLPVALAPTPGGADSEGCFTGTAVIQDGRPAILYTGVQTVPRAEATLSDDTNNFRESQCLAVATDDSLGTWKKLPAPVIPAPPPGMKVTGFRDPSPWRDGDQWYAVVGSGVAGKGGMVLLYRSRDLRSWEYLHPLIEGEWTGKPGPNPVDTAEMWECPDFFPLTDLASKAAKHVLIYSTQGKVLWQSGVLDKATMRFHPEKSGELDYGRVGSNRVTYYAPKTQLDANGNRILWGWISETRPDEECMRAGWSGMMSLPRVLTLRAGELQMEPAPQLARLRKPAAAGGPRHEFIARLRRQSSGTGNIELTDANGSVLTVHSDASRDERTMRISSGAGGEIPIPMPAALPDEFQLHLFVDRSVVEIFIDKRFCFTHRMYGRVPGAAVLTLTLPGRWRSAELQSFAYVPIWPV